MAWIFIDTTLPDRFRAGALRRGTHVPLRRGRGNRALPVLASTLGRKGIRDADGICVVSGPGSFSAVRGGVLLANLLARLFGKPLVGVTADDARDQGLLINALESGAYAPSGYVAPVYDTEPNITVAAGHRSRT